MTREEKYDAVNKCRTLEELADVIRSFGNEYGAIQGRTRLFDADSMASFCLMFNSIAPEYLTREFGIRQQGMMIIHYNDTIRIY